MNPIKYMSWNNIQQKVSEVFRQRDFIQIFSIEIVAVETLSLLHPLSVKNKSKYSGWVVEIWDFKFDVGALLFALMIFTQLVHWNSNEKVSFCPLLTSIRLKNSEKLVNFCLNLASWSSSAIMYCKLVSY